MTNANLKSIVTYTALLILTAAKSQVTIKPAPIQIHYGSEASKVMDDQMFGISRVMAA
jgi:hypothetical protein